MRVFYVGQDSSKRQALFKEKDDFLILGFDRWDDYDFKTTFPVYCRIGGREVKTGPIKILFENEKVSFSFLDGLVNAGWNGEFPVPSAEYISVPAAITFYEQIDGHLDSTAMLEVARTLKDASLRRWIDEDPASFELIESDGFQYSLLRERGAQAAYHNGWKFFNSSSINISDTSFGFLDSQGSKQLLNLEFDSAERLLPHDIHVIIGPNGVGKSQALMQMVESWLDLSVGEEGDTGFKEPTNINQMIVISYSPFERFPVDADNTLKNTGDRQDKHVYRYFGLRGWQPVFDEDGKSEKKIRLSQSRPKANAARSLLASLADDQVYGAIKDWSAKIKTIENVLKTAIDFDSAAVAVGAEVDVKRFFNDKSLYFLEKEISHEDLIYLLAEKGSKSDCVLIPISSDKIDALNVDALSEALNAGKGIFFLRNGELVELSSGQRLFSYVVINIIGAIRRNSLILIDEPELFLHPTLEIAFIGMLKELLSSYRSKALLATHSLVTVRELPRSCVHVFEKKDNEVFINHPPFETFGGDMQRISSYVFGDRSVSKPFETWIRQKLSEFETAESLIEALGDNINEEMVIQISAMGAGKW